LTSGDQITKEVSFAKTVNLLKLKPFDLNVCQSYFRPSLNGTTTLGITTPSITTFSIMTLSITTLSVKHSAIMPNVTVLSVAVHLLLF
jgi:hypothetical protein